MDTINAAKQVKKAIMVISQAFESFEENSDDEKFVNGAKRFIEYFIKGLSNGGSFKMPRQPDGLDPSESFGFLTALCFVNALVEKSEMIEKMFLHQAEILAAIASGDLDVKSVARFSFNMSPAVDEDHSLMPVDDSSGKTKH